MTYGGLPFFAPESPRITARPGESAYSSETIPPEPRTFSIPNTRPYVAPPARTEERGRPEMSIGTTARGPAHEPTAPPVATMKLKPYPRPAHRGYFDRRIAGMWLVQSHLGQHQRMMRIIV